jgi:hypothetical protein
MLRHLGLLLFPALLCAEGFQGWYQHSVWLRLDEKWCVGNSADFRADDGVGEIHTWIVSPRVRYDLNSTWQLQANFSALQAFNADETASTRWLRFEFEANPTFRLSETIRLNLRDRIEWRWREGGDEYAVRFRLRPQVEWAPRREGTFRGLYANFETFYDFDQDRFTEHRLTPLGLVFRPWDHGELRCYYIVRTARGAHGWRDYDGIGFNTAFNY